MRSILRVSRRDTLGLGVKLGQQEVTVPDGSPGDRECTNVGTIRPIDRHCGRHRIKITCGRP